MKKLFTFVAVAFVATLTSLNADAQVALGVRGGVNIAKLYKIGPGEWSSDEIGPHLGLIIGYSFSQKFSLQTEVNYSGQGDLIGYIRSEDGLTESGVINTRINYLSIPVLAKARFGSEKFGFFINGGPYIGYALSGRFRESHTLEGFGFRHNIRDEGEIDFKEDGLKRFDFGVTLGTGVMFKVGPGDIFVEGRYSYGLMDITDWDGERPEGESPLRNRYFTVSAGYIIPLGGR
ncbi:porin family protein [Cytophagaceae bacterium ABcell3]|nr:porin family protein [Cytophagaceae bacterium ABcell3]